MKAFLLLAILVIPFFSSGQSDDAKIKEALVKTYQKTHKVKKEYYCSNGLIKNHADDGFIQPFINPKFKSGRYLRFNPIEKSIPHFELVILKYSNNQEATATLDSAIAKFRQQEDGYNPFGKDFDYNMAINNYIIRISYPCFTTAKQWEAAKADIRKFCLEYFKVRVSKDFQVKCGGA